MSRYKIENQQELYFLTLTVVDWVDVFIRKTYKDIIIESLKYCQSKKGLNLYAFVIMSSHLHLIVETRDNYCLSDVIRDFKKYTATKILHEIKYGHYESKREWLLHRFMYRGSIEKDRVYQFWCPDNHPVQLYTLPVIAQKIGYIHENPVKEGWVENSEHYIYSSASNYYLERGILDVIVIDVPLTWTGYLHTL